MLKLVGQVDGWRDDFSAALGVVRGQGLALAARHLTEGSDVVVPQLVIAWSLTSSAFAGRHSLPW